MYTHSQECSDLGVDGQRVELVLLLGLSGSVKGPCDLWNGSSGDGGGNPDGGSCSAVQQVVSAHVQSDGRLNWRTNINQ